jgi:hypothetical protein
MPRSKAELVPTGNADQPYHIVIRRDGEVIAKIPVSSVDGAVTVVTDLLNRLKSVGV